MSLKRYLLLDRERKKIWTCVECRSKQPKTDNTNTPAYTAAFRNDLPPSDQGSSDDEPEIINTNIQERNQRCLLTSTSENLHCDFVTQRKKPHNVPNNIAVDYDSSKDTILAELKDFREQMIRQFSKQESRLDDFSNLLKHLNHCFTDLNNKYSTLRTDVDNLAKTVEKITDENILLRNTTEYNNKRIEELQAKNIRLGNDLLHVKEMLSSPISESSSISEQLNIQSYSAKVATTNPKAYHTSEPLVTNLNNETELNPNPSIQRTGRTMFKYPHQRIVKGNGQHHELLQTVEKTKRIHACYFKPDTSADAVTNYIQNICNNSEITVIKLKLKHEHYASFMITLPESEFPIFMMPESWPEGTQVSEWFQRGAGRAKRHHHRQHTLGRDSTKTDGSNN